MEFKANEAGVYLTVTDEGVGFDVAKITELSEGLGLVSMRERIRAIGGSVQIHSRPDCGTSVVAHIPVVKSLR